MPTHRYTTEDDYARERPQRRDRERDIIRDSRESRESREPRDTRGDTRGPRMEVDRNIRGDVRMAGDPMDRMGETRDPRANTTARMAGGGRNIRGGQQDDEMMYDIRAPGYPQGRREASYEDDFSEIPAPVRPVIDPGPRPEKQPRPNYNEYFLPGDGIDREVIQSEICRFLGQDATCKPGLHTDGRRGYIIRGYRALTTEMIRSLKEDSLKYMREKERAAARKERAVPYSTMRDRIMMMYEDDTMMTDDMDRMEPRGDYRSSQAQPQYDRYPSQNIRGGSTTSYMPDSGLNTSYQPVPAMPPQSQGYDPRFVPGPPVGAGNTTPPSSRTPGYTGSGGYTSTTRPPTSSTAAYDPRYDTVRGGGAGNVNVHSSSTDTRRFRS